MDHETPCMALRLMPLLRLSAALPVRDISFSHVLGKKRFRLYEVLQIFINEYRGVYIATMMMFKWKKRT